MDEQLIDRAQNIVELNEPHESIIKDNGIFEFMDPDRAIELYKDIHLNNIPKLDWKFYGRRKPGEKVEQEEKSGNEQQQKDCNNLDKDIQNDEFDQTEFDFDEEFGDADLSDSLCLKKRPDQISERRTNLSDIMSDIMKEVSHAETPEVNTILEEPIDELKQEEAIQLSEPMLEFDQRDEEESMTKVAEAIQIENTTTTTTTTTTGNDLMENDDYIGDIDQCTQMEM